MYRIVCILFQLKIKDVHIRYEDDTTIPGQLFALGVTIESLTAQSCDNKWMPRFVGWDSGNTSFKLIELNTFAVYWDKLTDDQLLGGLSLDELAVSMFYKIMWIGQDNGLTRGWMIGDLRFDCWQVCTSATTSRLTLGMKLTTHIHLVLKIKKHWSCASARWLRLRRACSGSPLFCITQVYDIWTRLDIAETVSALTFLWNRVVLTVAAVILFMTFWYINKYFVCFRSALHWPVITLADTTPPLYLWGTQFKSQSCG